MNRTKHLNKPKRDVATVDASDGLPVAGRNVRPQKRFAYLVYPKSWEYIDGYGFLPVLRRIVAMPGANGVSSRGSISRAVSSAIEKGGTYIDPKDQRLGDYMDYVQYYDCNTGEKWYVDFCQKATVLPGGEIMWNANEAGPEMMKFRAHLRDCGIVPALAFEVYSWLVGREQNKHDNLLARSAQNPHLGKRATAAAERIDKMRAAWESSRDAKIKTGKIAGRRPRRKAAEVMEA